jgi:hypothetical protein
MPLPDPAGDRVRCVAHREVVAFGHDLLTGRGNNAFQLVAPAEVVVHSGDVGAQATTSSASIRSSSTSIPSESISRCCTVSTGSSTLPSATTGSGSHGPT